MATMKDYSMGLTVTIKRMLPCAVLAVVACLALPDRVRGETPPPPKGVVADPVIPLPSWSPLIKRVLPAVVNVSAEISPGPLSATEMHGGQSPDSQDNPAGSPFDDFLRRYFEQRGLPSGTMPLPPGMNTATDGKILALGSGFIIDPSGYIVTNNHVVDHATKVTVIFQDNSTRTATIVGSDPKIDIALLKVSIDRALPFLQWGDSNAVDVGDWVIAVGNPFGLGGTVTAGIVSGLGRDLQQGPFDDFLQIDAPINRGNSGGPTFDRAGRVIGINTSIYSPTGGSVGIGFAIPSSTAKVIVDRLRETGHAAHGYLGIGIQDISPDIARVLHMNPDKPQGLLVSEVLPDGPGAKADLRPGDVIKEANGHVVQVPQDFSKLIVTAQVGEKLRMIVDRNGLDQTVELIVGQAPSQQTSLESDLTSGGGVDDAATAMGIWFAALTPDVRRELHLEAAVAGVVIGGVKANSAAASAGLAAGDLVTTIDRQAVADPSDAMLKLRSAVNKSEDVLLLVSRHGRSEFIVLSPHGEAPKN